MHAVSRLEMIALFNPASLENRRQEIAARFAGVDPGVIADRSYSLARGPGLFVHQIRDRRAAVEIRERERLPLRHGEAAVRR
jgi:hypothetical protein